MKALNTLEAPPGAASTGQAKLEECSRAIHNYLEMLRHVPDAVGHLLRLGPPFQQMTTRRPVSRKGMPSQLKKGPSSVTDSQEEEAGYGRDQTQLIMTHILLVVSCG